MRAKDTIQIFSSIGSVTRLDAVRRLLYVLIIIAAIGILGLISLPQKASIFHSHFLDNLTQQNYLLPDEEDFGITKDDLSIKSLKGSFEFFSIASIKLITSPLNSHWEIFSDPVNSCSYISIFVSLPLRSPPYLFLTSSLYA